MTRALPLIGLQRTIPRTLDKARQLDVTVIYPIKPVTRAQQLFIKDGQLHQSSCVIDGAQLHQGYSSMESKKRGQSCLSFRERCGVQEAGTRYGYSPESPLRDAIDPKDGFVCLHLIISYQVGKLSAPTSNSSYAREREDLPVARMRSW